MKAVASLEFQIASNTERLVSHGERIGRLEGMPVMLAKISEQVEGVAERMDEVRDEVRAMRDLSSRIKALETAEEDRKRISFRVKIASVTTVVGGALLFIGKAILNLVGL